MFIVGGGCVWDHHPFCKNGRGSRITQHIGLNDFDGVSLGLDATVWIAQGSESDITINAQENILDELDLRVRNNTLFITTDRCIWDHSPIEIFITIPEVKHLILSGAGQIVGENKFTSENIEILVSGSGSIALSLESGRVESTITGSGDLMLEGTANVASHRISGSGNLRAFDLKSTTAEIIVSGSGRAQVWVTNYLAVNISGSGQVFYHGTPTMDLNISGSGKVVDAN
jgi:hypothetical protein